MSENKRNEEETVLWKTIYDETYKPILSASSPGDIVYVQYSGEVSEQRIHAVVHKATQKKLSLRSRMGEQFCLCSTPTGVQITGEDMLNIIPSTDIYHLERIPEDMAATEKWSVWEVHLCQTQIHESSDDEILFPEARTRDEAIKFARRRSTNNPPDVGPVYNEGSPKPK